MALPGGRRREEVLPGSCRRRAQQEEGRARGRSREADQLAGLTRRQADVRAQDEADRAGGRHQ